MSVLRTEGSHSAASSELDASASLDAGQVARPVTASSDSRAATAQTVAVERTRSPGVTLLGQRFDAITESQTLDHVMGALDRGEGGWVVTANLDHLRRLRRDRAYAGLCRQASLVVADGMPLIWAAQLQGTPLPQRVAGSSMIDTLSARAAAAGRSVFLLGGAPGTAEGAAAALAQRYPGLRIAGAHCPPMGFERDEAEWARIRDQLIRTRPAIVYVALGSPKQERLIERFRRELPEAWWLGVGVSFSFVTGHVSRAPHWMQAMGLEWVHRLAQEPRRLRRRYLVQGLPFGLRLLSAAAAGRLRRG